MSEGYVFCDRSWMRAAEIFIEAPRCLPLEKRHELWLAEG